MAYDVDVIVIGGGPAGISAAIRARWVKRYKAIACSTLIIENANLGGLASWQGCNFTGPGWKIPKADMDQFLHGDIDDLNIPVYQGRVVRVGTEGDVKRVYTEDGKIFTSLAVIIASGIKVLFNEKEYYGKGLEVTSMGYEYMVEHLRFLLARKWEPRLVIVGSPKLWNLIPLIRELNKKSEAAGSEILFVIENGSTQEEEKDIISGWVERYTGKDRLEGIILQTDAGQKEFPCGGVLLDFNSYEISPQTRVALGSDVFGNDFIPVDTDMRTQVPGILAAGDVTKGGYNSFSRAVSQGITAGLSVYEDVFVKKFGYTPPLFAYRPSDFKLNEDFQELPPLDAQMRPYALSPIDDIRKTFNLGGIDIIENLNGRKTIEEIGQELNVPLPSLKEKLLTLADKKMITFHIGIL